jgi:hypothetical protein
VWKTHRQALVEAAAECVEVGAGGVAAVRLEELGRHVRRGAAALAALALRCFRRRLCHAEVAHLGKRPTGCEKALGVYVPQSLLRRSRVHTRLGSLPD